MHTLGNRKGSVECLLRCHHERRGMARKGITTATSSPHSTWKKGIVFLMASEIVEWWDVEDNKQKKKTACVMKRCNSLAQHTESSCSIHLYIGHWNRNKEGTHFKWLPNKCICVLPLVIIDFSGQYVHSFVLEVLKATRHSFNLKLRGVKSELVPVVYQVECAICRLGPAILAW